MEIRAKIEARLELLEEQLRAGRHLQSEDDATIVLDTISSVAKFWSALSDADRDFINAARSAVKGRLKWS